MGKTRNRAKNHHYIPQCYLKQFAIKYKGRKVPQLSVFDRINVKTHIRQSKTHGCMPFRAQLQRKRKAGLRVERTVPSCPQ